MISVTFQYQRDPKLLVKEMKPIIKEELAKVMAYWHRFIFPRRFTTQAKAIAKYRAAATHPRAFRKRTEAYQKRKARHHHHGRILEFDGGLRRRATTITHVSASPRQGRVHIKIPNFLRGLSARHNAPNLVEELKTATDAEYEFMAQLFQRRIVKRFNELKEVKTKKARS
jgi:hypothetical protein